jgi:hypothetical protein
MECEKLAKFRIDFVKDAGPDHAFACEDDLKEIILEIITAARGRAVRISMLSAESDEPCELGVE